MKGPMFVRLSNTSSISATFDISRSMKSLSSLKLRVSGQKASVASAAQQVMLDDCDIVS
jgi:hypothetical protein